MQFGIPQEITAQEAYADPWRGTEFPLRRLFERIHTEIPIKKSPGKLLA
jgi:hypothetical protein